MDIRHNEAEHRFETGSEPELAKLDYRMSGATVDLLHTEVPAASQGQGIAGKLAAAALDWARSKGLKVIPTCPYIRGYIDKHPVYADLV